MEKRIFSLDKTFMDFHSDDIVYSFMRTLSTAKPVDKRYKEYLPLTELTKHKRVLAGICGCSTRTINRKIDSLIEKGLVDTELLDNKTVYIFPIDKEQPFKLVDKEVLKYLIYTRNPQCIRVYLYLLNKYQWKSDYVFTIQEIKIALGYSLNTKTADEIIKTILTSFSAEGIIKFSSYYESAEVGGKIVPTPKHRLSYVLSSPNELPRSL